MKKQHKPKPLRIKHFHVRHLPTLLELQRAGIVAGLEYEDDLSKSRLLARGTGLGDGIEWLDASSHPKPKGPGWGDVYWWLCGNPGCQRPLVHFDKDEGALLEDGFVWSKQKKKYIVPESSCARIPEHVFRNLEANERDPLIDRLIQREVERGRAAEGRRPRRRIVLKEDWLPTLICCPTCGHDSIIQEVTPPDAGTP